jgi:hypothetical protein
MYNIMYRRKIIICSGRAWSMEDDATHRIARLNILRRDAVETGLKLPGFRKTSRLHAQFILNSEDGVNREIRNSGAFRPAT